MPGGGTPLAAKEVLDGIAGGVFGYEAFALITRLVPPLTRPLRRHPLLGAAVVGLLAYHLASG